MTVIGFLAVLSRVTSVSSPMLCPVATLAPDSNTVVYKIEMTCLYIQSPGERPTDSNLIICKFVIMELLGACVLHQCTQFHDDFPEWLNTLVLSMQNPDNFGKKIPELIEEISYSYSYIQK